MSSRAKQWSKNEDQLLLGKNGPEEFAFHTGLERAPSITIDLGRVCNIRGVDVQNRRRSHQERAASLALWISRDGQAWREVWRASDPEPHWTVDLRDIDASVSARYLRLGLRGPEEQYLHLRKVRVFGAAE